MMERFISSSLPDRKCVLGKMDEKKSRRRRKTRKRGKEKEGIVLLKKTVRAKAPTE
jgi:hypothetical protein